MNPIHQFNEREEKYLEEEFTKKFGAENLDLFLVPQINRDNKIWAIENVTKDIQRHLQASNIRAMQFVLDRVREGVEKEKCEVPEKPYAKKMKEISLEFVDKLLLYAGRVNYNKALDDVTSILDDLSALMEQK